MNIVIISNIFLFYSRQIANLYNKILSDSTKENATPLWVLCNPSSDEKTLLITVQSNENCFARGVVTYEGSSTLEEIDLERYVDDYVAYEKITEEAVMLLFLFVFFVSVK